MSLLVIEIGTVYKLLSLLQTFKWTALLRGPTAVVEPHLACFSCFLVAPNAHNQQLKFCMYSLSFFFNTIRTSLWNRANLSKSILTPVSKVYNTRKLTIFTVFLHFHVFHLYALAYILELANDEPSVF